MNRKAIREPLDILSFALAGNAIFTLQGKTSRFTYRARVSEDKKMFFVSLMTGPDNESSYQYLGFVRNAGHEWVHGTKSKIAANAPGSRAFAWFWSRLTGNKPLTDMEFWHEGKCGRCGRRLTVPASIERGIGPECAGIMQCIGSTPTLV